MLLVMVMLAFPWGLGDWRCDYNTTHFIAAMFKRHHDDNNSDDS